MLRRCLAIILLVMLGLSCGTHGLLVVQCQCSGEVSLAAVAADCCEECDGAGGETAGNEGARAAETLARTICDADCWVALIETTALLSSANVKADASAPMLLPVFLVDHETSPVIWQVPLPLRVNAQPAPPGASRFLLHRSLRI